MGCGMCVGCPLRKSNDKILFMDDCIFCNIRVVPYTYIKAVICTKEGIGKFKLGCGVLVLKAAHDKRD